ncbi:cysteine-rich venom protein TEL1-like [Discoglossus pictus]
MMLIGVFCLATFLRYSEVQALSFHELSTNNETVSDFIVDLHNLMRSQVKPPASNMVKMTWSLEAARSATCWAKSCITERSTVYNRAIPNFVCGDNVYVSSKLLSWLDVIEYFYSQVENFEYGKGAKSVGLETGHYTQVVWYNSYQLGCAFNVCKNKVQYYTYVCHYCPGGNNNKLLGRPYETGQACGSCVDSCESGLCTNPCKYQDISEYCNPEKCQCSKAYQQNCAATCFCTNDEIK